MLQALSTFSEQPETMPVDPSILMKYEDPPPMPTRSRDRFLPALGGAAAGTALIGGATWACAGNLGAAKVLAAIAIMLIVINTLIVVVQGWNEDGATGVFYRMRHPLGTVWNGDDRNNSWMSLARWWLVAMLMVSVFVLCSTTPGLGKWLNVTRARGPAPVTQP